MSAHEFRQGVHDDVRSVLNWTQENRRGDGIVDDQGNAVCMRELGERGNVTDVAGGIADGFAE